MDRLSRIQNIIRWQELYQDKKVILSAYETNELKLAKLKEEFETSQKTKAHLTETQESLSKKISSEEERLDFILTQIDTMEKDRDNLKMSRQIKSWEKDMEKYAQDRAVIEAQFYYDKSKLGDITQELENIDQNLDRFNEDIGVLESAISQVKADTKEDRDRIDQGIDDISSQFDTHFVQYFDRLLLKNRGIVMAEIEEDSCSGCNVLLPTSYHGGDTLQDSEDLALLQCPNCFRYLYHVDDIM